MSLLKTILGPRVPVEELQTRPGRYLAPAVTLTLARIALVLSLFFPYWQMELQAPQYPDGLHMWAYVNHLQGDVAEIDGLNHYIGMRPLNEAATLERAMSIYAIVALVLLVEGMIYIHSKWAVLLALPAITFPAVFLLDLWYWMHSFGNNLDPRAPLSSAIKPFTPPILGVGTIGQFKTVASMGPGLILAWTAAGLIIVGLILHRRAYKPLFDAARSTEHGEVPTTKAGVVAA
jgi:hypothetical protein